jgi:hypothetical protein
MIAETEVTVVSAPLFLDEDTVVELRAAPEAEVDVDLLVELWFDELMI